MDDLEVTVCSQFPGLIEELRNVLPELKFDEVGYDNAEALNKSEILIGDYTRVAPFLYDLKKVKWLQATWAGAEDLFVHVDPAKPLPMVVTRFSNAHYGRMMSEYVVTSIVNHERGFFKIFDNQKQARWEKEGNPNICDYRMISDLTVGILGIGTLGSCVGKTLKEFGAKVLGCGRRPLSECKNDTSYISEYYNTVQLEEMLRRCDYLVNMLPSTKETAGLLNGSILENCKRRKTVFINIGRGNIITESQLIEALDSGWLSYTILDVFETEPLHKDSKLWAHEKILITPHVAAINKVKLIAEFFKDNLGLYREGKTMMAVIDFSKEY